MIFSFYLLQNPLFIFSFLAVKIPLIILSLVWISALRKQILILQDLATEGESPCGKPWQKPVVHSYLLRFSFLKGTPFLKMMFSKCGLQARVLALENLLKWKLLAPPQTYETRNSKCTVHNLCFNKPSRWFWGLLKFENHCLRESFTDHLW